MKQFAIIGLGRFGTSLALTLTRMGYDVLAVDTNEEKVNNIMEKVTHAVQVDAMDEQALKALGIRNFDVVIVAIGQDIQTKEAWGRFSCFLCLEDHKTSGLSTLNVTAEQLSR